jgi:uncharacterized protein
MAAFISEATTRASEADMRTSDCDILIVPGYQNSGPDHWQSRWQQRLSTARRIDMPDWEKPVLADWVAALVSSVAAATKPVVIVAHSLGVLAVVHAAPALGKNVIGAVLVCPPSEGSVLDIPAIDLRFALVPRERLPFKSVVVASSNDPYCPLIEAEEWAAAWGADILNAGESGHLNIDSGHGPWPEGLMSFAGFMGKL